MFEMRFAMSRTASPTPRPVPRVLSQYARNLLATMAEAPKAADEVNPGLKDRLQERGLVEVALLPHPREPKRAPFLLLTDAGRAELSRYRGGRPA
jgi:hypothetical protein